MESNILSLCIASLAKYTYVHAIITLYLTQLDRIDCFADGQLGNINPELTYDGAVIRGPTLNQDWPLHVSYSYPTGLTVDRAGRYMCRTASGNNITHYFQSGKAITV